jgi:hypothetical protein
MQMNIVLGIDEINLIKKLAKTWDVTTGRVVMEMVDCYRLLRGYNHGEFTEAILINYAKQPVFEYIPNEWD